MAIAGGYSILIEMSPAHFEKFKALGEQSGLTDPTLLFQSALDLLEKAVNARMKGRLVGTVPGDAEAGKNGIIEILLSQEILAQEAAKAPGVLIQ